MSYAYSMELGEAGQLINLLRSLGQHDLADWVSCDTISRADFDPDEMKRNQYGDIDWGPDE